MAIFIAAALSRLVTVTCPHCGQRKQVERRPAVAYRVCPRCHRRYSDPAPKAKRR